MDYAVSYEIDIDIPSKKTNNSLILSLTRCTFTKLITLRYFYLIIPILHFFTQATVLLWGGGKKARVAKRSHLFLTTHVKFCKHKKRAKYFKKLIQTNGHEPDLSPMHGNI